MQKSTEEGTSRKLMEKRKDKLTLMSSNTRNVCILKKFMKTLFPEKMAHITEKKCTKINLSH